MGLWRRAALAVAGAIMMLGAAASAQAKDVLGATCTRPAADRCVGEVCNTSGALAHLGTATDPATGRKFFLDYPCDLKPGEKVTFILNIFLACWPQPGRNDLQQDRLHAILRKQG